MIHQSMLIGWPKYDPKRYRFVVPNQVWEHKLKPTEFMILSYICYCRSHGLASVLTPEIVAEGIHKTENTVRKHLPALVRKKLVTGELNLAPDLQHISGEKFFTLPNEIFLLRHPPSAFVVYAYLLLIEDRRTHTCHPSYSTIADKTGLSKNTAMKCVSALVDMGLITMESTSYLDKHGMKWKGNNLYTILPIRVAVDKFNRQQLRQLELDAKRRQVQARLSRRCAPQEPLSVAGEPATQLTSQTQT